MADEVDHTHGSTGSKPPQDLNFEDGDFPNPEQFDWFWSEVPSAINDHASRLDAIDSDGDGIVDQADSVTDPYTDSDAVSAVDSEVDNAASSVAGLDDVVGGIDNPATRLSLGNNSPFSVDATGVELNFGEEDFDTNNWGDVSNNNITVGQDGIYQVSARAQLNGVDAPAYGSITLRKNGSQVREAEVEDSGTNSIFDRMYLELTDLIQLNSGDTLTVDVSISDDDNSATIQPEDDGSLAVFKLV